MQSEKISLRKWLLSRDLNDQKRPYSQEKEQEEKSSAIKSWLKKAALFSAQQYRGVVSWVMTPKDMQVLIPPDCECYLIWWKGLWRCDEDSWGGMIILDYH